MPDLFEKTSIKSLTLRNRFIRSATWEGMALEDGTCTPQLEALYKELAEGQIGLIISGHAYVSEEGKATPWQLGIYKDEQIAPLGRLTKAVHDRNGTIVAQLAHAGQFTDRKLTGVPPLALSITGEKGGVEYRKARTEDLEALPAAFARAALRAQAAGFDGIQLHAAHSYLLSQSLSPAFNQRTDQYGGSPENRMRLLMEVLSAVRKAVSKDYPLLVKLNCADFIEGGVTVEASLKVAHRLQDAGIDAIEVSGGTLVSGALGPVRAKIDSEDREAYFRQAAKQFKEELAVPIILVGGVRSITLAETLLAEGVTDYFSMARPFIREPHLVKRWEAGDRRKSTCISDNQCNKAARSGKGVYCVVEENEKKAAVRMGPNV